MCIHRRRRRTWTAWLFVLLSCRVCRTLFWESRIQRSPEWVKSINTIAACGKIFSMFIVLPLHRLMTPCVFTMYLKSLKNCLYVKILLLVWINMSSYYVHVFDSFDRGDEGLTDDTGNTTWNEAFQIFPLALGRFLFKLDHVYGANVFINFQKL